MDNLATQLLHDLHAGALCVVCGTRQLMCDKWDFLKATRILVTSGLVRCEFAKCQACGVMELIVSLRPQPRWGSSSSREGS